MGKNIKKQGWEFGGGKQEGDESMAQAAVREFTEETGITVAVTEVEFLGYTDKEPGWLCMVFVCKFQQCPTPQMIYKLYDKLMAYLATAT